MNNGKVGRTKRGKGTKLLAVRERLWSSCRHSHGICFAATPVELVERTIGERFTDERPQKMIGDKA